MSEMDGMMSANEMAALNAHTGVAFDTACAVDDDWTSSWRDLGGQAVRADGSNPEIVAPPTPSARGSQKRSRLSLRSPAEQPAP